MKRLNVCVAWIAIGAASLVRADEPVFQFSKEVTASPKQEESLAAVALDADVFAATQDGLPDLRLIDAAGKPTPFVVRKSLETRDRTARHKTWAARKPVLKPLDNGGLEITLELEKDDPQPNGLSLITPLRNFEQRVRVLSSADGQTWEPAGDETVIFDYSRYMDVRNDSVPFIQSPRRHFRIVIDDVTAEQESELLELTRRLRGTEETARVEKVTIDRRPFRIERIDLWQDGHQEQVTGDRQQAYPMAGFKVSEDPKTKQTIITVEARREPLTSLELVTSSRNFSRHAVVEVEEKHGVTSSWRQVGEATVSCMDFKNFKREHLAIKFPESRQTRYRIVIDNRDSPPLTVTGIQATGSVYELVFLSASGQPHRLAYGSEDAAAPQYDTAAIQTLLGESHRPEPLSLGRQQANSNANAPVGFHWSKLVNDPRLLVGTIGLLVIVLGWGLYRAAKRMDKLPPE